MNTIIKLLLLSIISSFFIPYKVYPYFIIVFIFYCFTYFIYKKKCVLIRSVTLLFLVSYLIWGSAVLLSTIDVSNIDFSIKLTINNIALIILFIILCNSNLSSRTPNYISTFCFFVVLINSTQLFFDIYSHNIWLLPFNLETSASSDILNEIPRLIGEQNKNIWASKVVLIYAIHVSLFSFRFERSKFRFILSSAFCTFFIFYSCSRTAQFIFSLSLMVNVTMSNFFSKKNKFIIFFIITAAFFYAYLSQEHRYSHLDFSNLSSGHNGDGFKARIILWMTLFNAIYDFSFLNIMTGHGILFASRLNGWVFAESNMHNVFLNMFVDIGVIGLVLYTLSLISLYFFLPLRDKFSNNLRLKISLFFPLLFCMLVQYTGYDFDVISYIALSLIVLSIDGKKRHSFVR
ncbi:hypothetical protein CE143_24720 [Photorhabdus luminescens]|uniref:O-antigen ligase-related domain-containing protein n=1 Tax=Photorhabdus akhurstii TaxID=171438 RepID=A0ABX8M0G3_9GAMM|nr:hypothetical protein B0X70_24680 [Photorhabdus akhurstii]UJD77866.1 hypothetical protein CE143_24720 [Photorhabdus luminescens]